MSLAAGRLIERDVTTGVDLLASLPTMRLKVNELKAGLDAYILRRDGPVKSLVARGVRQVEAGAHRRTSPRR